MTRTQRQTELNDRIFDRIKQAAYKAFYIYHLKPTERGTMYGKVSTVRSRVWVLDHIDRDYFWEIKGL